MKMSKSKILVSLVVIVLAIAVVGNIISLAAEPVQITSNGSSATDGNTENKNTNTNTNSNTNSNTDVVGKATNTNNNTNTNKNTNTNTNSNTNTKTSNYESTNSSKLPYAGTAGSSVVILAVAFAASAIYAYKKVTDYNV